MSDSASDSSPGESRSMLPESWSELSPLIDAVLDVPTEQRAALLTELSGGNSSRRAELERLVAECERDVSLFDRPAAEQFDELVGDAIDVPPPEVLGGRYKIDREVGRGGMARVYLARDLKHARDVAVKVVRPDLAASLGRERFLDEIRIAARLRHPNIVPLYDSGDADGVLYFVMPYEEGPSLRTRLQSGERLPMAECVSTLRDVARALAYAHEHDVVHRDVKPDNVMLSGGAAVVADFGIARALSAAAGGGPERAHDGRGRLTGGASSLVVPLGTPAYLAPEQAAGDPSTDHRADIYSFGCLAYELFTGSVPFGDQSVQSLAHAHRVAVPPLVTAFRDDVAPAVAQLVARCLEKNPADRPQSARDLLVPLDETAPVASPATALAGELRPRAWTARWMRVAVVAGALGAAVYVATRLVRAPMPLPLAVLPFGTIGTDSATDIVAHGLADEVAGSLTRVPGILIKSRLGALAYRGKTGVDVTEAGTRLKADYLMTGIVRQEQGQWILSADLVRAADGASLWGESFNLNPNEQAGAAEAIAARLVVGLQKRFPKLVGAVPALGSHQTTSNNDAYTYYGLGQNKLTQRSQSVKESAELFGKAISHDSMFAKAYSGLSMALALYPNQQGYAVKDIHDRLVSAARRAIALDPTLAQPHIALGMAHGFDYQWDSAAAEFRTAIRLDDRDVEAHVQYGRHLRNRGRVAEALTQLRAARAQDPASAVVLSQLSYAYYLDNQMDSALAESQRALESDPNNRTSVVMGALVRLRINQPDSARKLIERAPATTPFIAYVIAKSGDVDSARRLLARQDAETPQPAFAETRRAYTYLGLGDTANALAALERATDAKEIWPVLESYLDPVHDPIRHTARFRALLRRVGLGP